MSQDQATSSFWGSQGKQKAGNSVLADVYLFMSLPPVKPSSESQVTQRLHHEQLFFGGSQISLQWGGGIGAVPSNQVE